MSFNTLGLSDALLRAIDQKGYTVPSPIQQKAIPPIIEGKGFSISTDRNRKNSRIYLTTITTLISGSEIKKKTCASFSINSHTRTGSSGIG